MSVGPGGQSLLPGTFVGCTEICGDGGVGSCRSGPGRRRPSPCACEGTWGLRVGPGLGPGVGRAPDGRQWRIWDGQIWDGQPTVAPGEGRLDRSHAQEEPTAILSAGGPSGWLAGWDVPHRGGEWILGIAQGFSPRQLPLCAPQEGRGAWERSGLEAEASAHACNPGPG